MPPVETDVRRRENIAGVVRSREVADDPHTPRDHVLLLAESLNRAIDRDVETLADSFEDITRTASILNKDHYRVMHEALMARVRTDAMLGAARSLLALTHTLKMLHVFCDTDAPLDARHARARDLRDRIHAAVQTDAMQTDAMQQDTMQTDTVQR